MFSTTTITQAWQRRGTSSRMRSWARRGAIATAIPAMAFAAVAVDAPAASAAYAQESYISSNSGGANLRDQPNTGSGVRGYMRNGTRLHMQCWTDAQTVSPPNSNYTSARWFYIATTAVGGTFGWVHSSLVASQINVPHC